MAIIYHATPAGRALEPRRGCHFYTLVGCGRNLVSKAEVKRNLRTWSIDNIFFANFRPINICQWHPNRASPLSSRNEEYLKVCKRKSTSRNLSRSVLPERSHCSEERNRLHGRSEEIHANWLNDLYLNSSLWKIFCTVRKKVLGLILVNPDHDGWLLK